MEVPDERLPSYLGYLEWPKSTYARIDLSGYNATEGRTF